ncbi:hypothetical protein [Nocardia brasiliensis]|uniref:Uncharacterized protein n=1 Tax=Nocardia brasiliensis (strain ATCC 700358 / HUJEG-1) TaxID=1133849 RepID=K0EQI6_NOCB7|nr:hypothetical protein [Nocardia brasiliensis]AFT99094.1 hypothetical protein O3I_005660 [Nocardia brasiliensis ATCC 700358]OCF87255.1 hypothetical protein AW168_27850 [Nocardia brasiliensis]
MNRIERLGYDTEVNPIWRYEIRRCGLGVLAPTPLAGVVIGIALVAFDGAMILRTVALEVVPLTAGLVTAAVLGRERMLELHLTVRTPYPQTVVRRLVLVGASVCGAVASIGALGWSAAAVAAGPLLVSTPAFALALISVATFVVVASGSAAGASAIVVTVWSAKLLVLDQIMRGVWAQAAVAVTLAALFAWAAAVRVADSEAQLREVRA